MPLLADVAVVQGNELHDVGEIPLRDVAAIVGKDAAARGGQPDFRCMFRRPFDGNVNVNRFSVSPIQKKRM